MEDFEKKKLSPGEIEEKKIDPVMPWEKKIVITGRSEKKICHNAPEMSKIWKPYSHVFFVGAPP